MKMSIWFVAASLLIVAGNSRAQDTKSDSKFVLDVLDKLHGLKTKSVVTAELKAESGIRRYDDKSAAKSRITITFSFSRDLKSLAELQSLADVFTVSTGIPYRFDNLPLIFHFFDDDNVCIDKVIISAIEGDLSGVKGDAFRVVLNCRTETLNRAKRIEARYYPPLRVP